MSTEVTDIALPFDVALDWLTSRTLGMNPTHYRRAIAAVEAELDRRDQVIQSQAAALDEAQATQDRACTVIREATDCVQEQRRRINELEEALAAMTATALRVRP